MSPGKQNSQSDETTHFGFSTVNAEDKATLVKGVFDNVASRYDLMNDLMSLGVHRLWKSAMIDWLRPSANMSLIDVGGGTGDIAFRFLKSGGGDVTVCDINDEMLSVGRDRSLDNGITKGISWVNGDAEKLPVPDSSFDAFTIAFCIRNVTHIENALNEARRVLKPGGHFLCLEFSHVALAGLESVYDTYSFKVLPWLGKLVANDAESYRYLAESIRRFPDQKTFATMITEAGLEQVTYRNLSGGIAAIHSAWRI
ncbi:MAG: bifunctional demethylmenaquinone methyltransferase/2-methoxy-6-polyprenyl-1,4-benzoquinol methylase UbiE [Rhodospirillaceae bacterium]|nr:bifunctional demethylmenaquinone methyltransferase/2-methoxy-6-polyprenyl-1,4-benzoquinol methylase UbiE [Rhodospirillaceae bacterium]MBT4219245.1 bifunctional demethylmenaquinone methyltransferase/2-methoxy-6-polyprenyl-1,4-benzoquinol methylase UbiE [Rhodospirillaceae bacterium]MBT4463057.1 bifunctional demethylmenaquinone methyltransferase/2-methoxy-6-polyprenyl-1,4-benzoquinol methylase UbiE [Rhodospirillaceae bacterium]MBT5308831.1 bifunctional demethylmenaquinone methyltransferase/2-met